MVPPHPRIADQVRAQGFDSLTVVNLRRLAALRRLKGIDHPRPIKAPLVGSRPALVLLVEFADLAHNAASPPTLYSSLLFSVGTYPAPGSMRDYYRQVSYGLYDISPNLVDGEWRRVSQKHTYYADNDGFWGTEDDYGFGPYPANVQGLVVEAVQAADPYVDFSTFAVGGTVEGLFVVHSGRGAETDPFRTDWIWSHQWYLEQYAVTVDGVRVDSYSMEPEYTYSPGDATVGVYCHEYGHLLGLWDLYDIDYTSAGLGEWSLMAAGCWNGPDYDGSCPTHFDAYSRIQLGWVSPQVVLGTVTGAAIPSVETSATIYRLWTNGGAGSEYFLLENRQPIGFDQSLPAFGLLLYHVDESAWQTDDWHPTVMLEQADGNWDLQYWMNLGDAGDPCPGAFGKRAVNANTHPSTRSYAEADTRVGLSSISDSGATMTAHLTVVGELGAGGVLWITNDPEKYQAAPAVSGHRIVWQDGWDTVYGVRLHDLATDESRWIATGSATQVLPAISGDTITWLDDRAERWAFHTLLYDLATSSEFQVSDQTYPNLDPAWQWPASVAGPLIAYTAPLSAANFDLYLYDLSVDSDGDGTPNWRDPDRPSPDPARRRLVSHVSNQKRPSISGRRIVWVDNRSGGDDIYLYDLDLDQEFPLCTQAAVQEAPDISAQYVVWTDYRSGNGDIYLYDLSLDSDGDGTPNWRESPRPSPDPAEQNLTPDAARQAHCHIDGRLVVWEDDRFSGASGTDIVLYDLAAKTLTPIIKDPWKQANPDVSEGLVVWQDNQLGNADIYAWGAPGFLGTVSGKVRDGRTKFGIAGATVSCGGVTRASGADGGFFLPFVPSGPAQVLMVTASGYYSASLPISVAGGAKTTVEIRMLPAGWGGIAGMVTNASTTGPVEGAMVSCGEASDRTGPDGKYLLAMLPGAGLVVDAVAAGYLSGQQSGVSVADGLTTVVNFALTPGPRGAIGGVVRDAETLAPIPGATVTCAGKSVATGLDGAYLLADLVPGTGYVVRADAGGYLSSQVSGVTVAERATTHVDFLLTRPSGEIAGVVRDRLNLEPVLGARVSCGIRTTTTGRGGFYKLVNVPVGSNYTVVAGALNYLTTSVTGVAVAFGQSTRVDFLLPPKTGSIGGTVRDATTRLPIAGATVLCSSDSDTTDAKGKFLFPALRIGTGYLVTASAPNHTSAAVAGLTVMENTTTKVDISLTPSAFGSITGTIKDWGTQAALAGATVTCGAVSTMTNPSGGYTLSGIPVATGYRVGAAAAGYYWGSVTGVSVLTNQTTTVHLSLNPLPSGRPQFEEVTAQANLPTAVGVGWGDYDRDGYPDLFLAGTNQGLPGFIAHGPLLYHNNRDLTFTNASAQFGLPSDPIEEEGVAFGDYDNDGDLDLLVGSGDGYPRLYRRDGAQFLEVAQEAGLHISPATGRGATWCDFDADNWLDAFISNISGPGYLVQNGRDGTFTDISAAAGMTGGAASDGAQSASWGDYDNDGQPDLLLARLAAPSKLYHNNGDGSFTDVSTESGIGAAVDAYSGVWADYDNDGWLDCYLTSADHVDPQTRRDWLFHNNHDGTFTDVASGAGMAGDQSVGTGAAWADCDNDGYLDLYVGNSEAGNQPFLYRNNGDGTFTNVVSGSGLAGSYQNDAAAWADFNLDGRLDLVQGTSNASTRLFRSAGPSRNWLRVRAVTDADGDATDGEPTREAIGARVELNVDNDDNFLPGRTLTRLIDGGSGFCGQNEQVAHFGVPAMGPVSVRVLFPDGSVVAHRSVPLNQSTAIRDVPPGREEIFDDVPLDFWAYTYIRAIVNANITTGYPDGTYRPTVAITRDQMAVFIARALVGGDSLVPPGPPVGHFIDVPTWYWAFKHIEYAYAEGVVTGYPGGRYEPTLALDRAQMAVFIARALAGGDAQVPAGPPTATFPDVGTGFWAYRYVEYIADPERKVTQGYQDGLYHPEYICTRDQMAAYIARAFKLPN